MLAYAGCEPAACNPNEQTTPPPCGFTCPAGQTRVCVDKCVTPRRLDETCVPGNVCVDGGLCATGLSCVQLGPTGSPWRCKDLGLTLGEHCTRNADYCAYPTFCSDDTCGGAGSICALPVGLNSECDGNFGDSIRRCRPCEAGLSCIGVVYSAVLELDKKSDEPTVLSFGRCRRSCNQANDCPCNTQLACTTGQCCNPTGATCRTSSDCCSLSERCLTTPNGGACGACKEHRAACRSSTDCCDPRAECQLIGATGTGECNCIGRPCETNADCCGGIVCASPLYTHGPKTCGGGTWFTPPGTGGPIPIGGGGGGGGTPGGGGANPRGPRNLLLGIPYDSTSIRPTDPARYEIEIEPGAPVALSTLEHAFVAVRGPNQINAYELGSEPMGSGVATVRFKFASPVDEIPTTLDTLVPSGTARGPDRFDAIVGGGGNLRWYGFSGSALLGEPWRANFRSRVDFVAATVSDASLHPYFEVVSTNAQAMVALTTPNGLGWANFDVPRGPTDTEEMIAARRVRGVVRVTELGIADAPVAGVVAGADLAWAAIRGTGGGSGRFVKLAPVTLTRIGEAALLPTDGEPVALDGGRLIPSDYTTSSGVPPASIDNVVVGMANGATSTSFLYSFPHGNPATPAPLRTNDFAGQIVALRVTVCTVNEFAYVVTRNPNRIYKFRIGVNDPLWTHELGVNRVPLPNGLSIGLQTTASLSAGDPTAKRKEECRPPTGSKTAMPGDQIGTLDGYIHVVVTETTP